MDLGCGHCQARFARWMLLSAVLGAAITALLARLGTPDSHRSGLAMSDILPAPDPPAPSHSSVSSEAVRMPPVVVPSHVPRPRVRATRHAETVPATEATKPAEAPSLEFALPEPSEDSLPMHLRRRPPAAQRRALEESITEIKARGPDPAWARAALEVEAELRRLQDEDRRTD